MRTFDSLSEREILALAISLEEEEDERIYADFAEGLRQDFPASAAVFDGMRDEESGHRRRLIDLFRERFGDHIPLVRRNDIRGFVRRKPVWLIRPLGLETVRNQASAMEVEANDRAAFSGRFLGTPSLTPLSTNRTCQQEKTEKMWLRALNREGSICHVRFGWLQLERRAGR
jgi:hypothetical protein